MTTLPVAILAAATAAAAMEAVWAACRALWDDSEALPRRMPPVPFVGAILAVLGLSVAGTPVPVLLAISIVVACSAVAAATDILTLSAHDIAFAPALLAAAWISAMRGGFAQSLAAAGAAAALLALPALVQRLTGRECAFGGADLIFVFAGVLALGPLYGAAFVLLGFSAVAAGSLPGLVAGRIVLGRGDPVAHLPGLACGFALAALAASPNIDILRVTGLAS